MSLLAQTVAAVPALDEAAAEEVRSHLASLAMPPWALGRLLDLAVELAGMTGQSHPPVERRTVVVMAGDHGVVDEGVSAFPRAVTEHMVRTMVRGGAGINVLGRQAGCDVHLVDLGCACNLDDLFAAGSVRNCRVAPGTANLALGPAMTREQAAQAVEAGIRVVQELGGSYDVFATGEMGIGNTTPATAVLCALAGCAPEEVTGRGTMIDDATLRHKTEVIARGLAVNRPDPEDGLDVLAKVGGFEIGGLAGVILGAAARRKPIVVDGFISTSAALVAHSLCPRSARYLIGAHRSQEPGHVAMHRVLGLNPLLDLQFRLGEGTGSAVAMHLLDGAVAIRNEMFTLEQALSGGN